MAGEQDTRVIGIDTSGDYGSGIAGALVDASGSLAARKVALTPRTRDDLIDSLATMGGRLLEQSRRDGPAASGLGVAVPGVVNEYSGIVHRTPNLTLDEVPLGPMLQERLGIPVFLVHDSFAGALAENTLGVGRGVADMLLVLVGSGVGGAAISGGRIIRGGHGAAGEIGHMSVDPAGTVCGCGGRGCVETLASEQSMVRRYTMAAGEAIPLEEIIKKAQAGHPAASRVWNEALAALASVIASAVLLLDCQLVVLHGPSRVAPEMLQPLRAMLATRMNLVQPPRVEVSSLGEDAGILGAAITAFDRVGMTSVTNGWREKPRSGVGAL